MRGSPTIPGRGDGRTRPERPHTPPPPRSRRQPPPAPRATGRLRAHRGERRAPGEPRPVSRFVDAGELGPHRHAPVLPLAAQARRLERQGAFRGVAPHGVTPDPPGHDGRGQGERGAGGDEGGGELEHVLDRILTRRAWGPDGLPPHRDSDREIGRDRRDEGCPASASRPGDARCEQATRGGEQTGSEDEGHRARDIADLVVGPRGGARDHHRALQRGQRGERHGAGEPADTPGRHPAALPMTGRSERARPAPSAEATSRRSSATSSWPVPDSR